MILSDWNVNSYELWWMAHETFDYGDFAIVNFTRELAAKDGLADELRLVVQA